MGNRVVEENRGERRKDGRPLGQREANGAPSPTAGRTGRRVGRAGSRREGRCDDGGGGGGRHNRVPPTASTLVPTGVTLTKTLFEPIAVSYGPVMNEEGCAPASKHWHEIPRRALQLLEFATLLT